MIMFCYFSENVFEESEKTRNGSLPNDVSGNKEIQGEFHVNGLLLSFVYMKFACNCERNTAPSHFQSTD